MLLYYAILIITRVVHADQWDLDEVTSLNGSISILPIIILVTGELSSPNP